MSILVTFLTIGAFAVYAFLFLNKLVIYMNSSSPTTLKSDDEFNKGKYKCWISYFIIAVVCVRLSWTANAPEWYPFAFIAAAVGLPILLVFTNKRRCTFNELTDGDERLETEETNENYQKLLNKRADQLGNRGFILLVLFMLIVIMAFASNG